MFTNSSGQALRGRKLLAALTAMLILVACLGTANVQAAEQTVAGWDFNDSNPIADTGIAANLDKSAQRETAVSYDYFAGSDGGMALASTGWTNGNGTKYWKVSFASTGYTGLKLSSKQRSSATGPKDFKVQYSLDGTGWTDVPGTSLTVGTSFNTAGSLSDAALPVQTENQSTVFLRWIMTSNNAAESGRTLGSSGTNRIDEIEISGTSTAPDSTPPSALSHTPGADADDAFTLSALTVKFNEAVEAVDITNGVTIYETGDPDATVSGISYDTSGDTLTIDHSKLENGTEYTVTIEADAIEDTAGNPLASDISWSFTTIGLSDIDEVDAIDPETGDPVIRGQNAAVSGAVLVGKGVLDANKTIYIQDATQGISVYCYDGIAGDIEEGDNVYVEGKLTSYQGLTEIQPESDGVYKDDYGIAMPDPEPISISDLTGASAEDYEGLLATLDGTVADVPSEMSGDGYNVVIADDSDNQIILRVMFNTEIDVPSTLQEGTSYTFTGVVGQYDTSSPYSEGYELFPRSSMDIVE